jgi:hypothetical protein
MSNMPWFVAWALVSGVVGAEVPHTRGSAADGVALAVVYDTSGSMNEPVRDDAGKLTPKHVIARRALQAVVQRLDAFVAGATTEAPRKLAAGLYLFREGRAREFIKLGPFEPATRTAWNRDLPAPSGGTPLGQALELAGRAVLDSPLSRKHVLVVTDGLNTVGADPARVLPGLKQQAADQGAMLAVHFIAFDLEARLFEPLRKQGVTVVSAADEPQLNAQLEFILAQRILLEDEEPPRTH